LKKIVVLTLSLIFVLALAVTATAGIRNTIHDFQSGTALSGFGGETAKRGMCSYCHIPHVAKGDRLWPSPGDTNSLGRAGIVGILCASCHNAAVGVPSGNTRSPISGGENRATDIYATLTINHVLIDDGIYANNTNQNYFAAGTQQMGQVNPWPYCGTQAAESSGGASAIRIECSSCHNPHSEAYGQSTITAESNGLLGYGNDYLRSSFYNTTAGVAFCEYCHEEKTRQGNAGNTIGTGTHPVGTTASANSVGSGEADIHIESLERAVLGAAGNIVSSVQYDMGIGTGAGTGAFAGAADNGIGNHLTSYSTGGVTCQTCHKVHGAPAGAQKAWRNFTGGNANSAGSYGNGAALYGNKVYLAASDDGNCNILAIENDANGGTVGYTYNTEGRASGDYNDLCIDCHETTPSVGQNWITFDNNANRTTADLVTDAHPVNIAPDGLSESGFDLTVKDPGWGSSTQTNARWAGSNGVAYNFNLAVSGRWWGVGGTANATSEIICLTCHSIHDGENGTPILRARTQTYCVDCHTYSIGTVSHPVGYSSRMIDDPDGVNWPNGDSLPLADYYNGDTSVTPPKQYKHGTSTTVNMECFTCHAAHDGVDDFMLRVTDDNSRICAGCHTNFATSENPSNLIAEYEETATTRLGSHYTGAVSNTTDRVGETRWTYSGAWTDTEVGGAKKQTSHWVRSSSGGGQGSRTGLRMQCQSCHTPHNAASGLVEVNGYDGDGAISGIPTNYNSSDNENWNTNYDGTTNTPMCATPTTALLLGNNGASKMCATCHWPKGTHVTTIYTVPAKPDPMRVASGNNKRKYRDYTSRTERFIIAVLNGEQEYQYNVYDLIADGRVTGGSSADDGVRTPESPTNFPPLQPGKFNIDSAATPRGLMVCDSCHAPHAAATGPGAFILEGGTGDATGVALANQRVDNRNYQNLCFMCHDK